MNNNTFPKLISKRSEFKGEAPLSTQDRRRGDHLPVLNFWAQVNIHETSVTHERHGYLPNFVSPAGQRHELYGCSTNS